MESKVFVEHNHQEVLKHWIKYHLSSGTSPVLISFDFHTDTKEAFTHYSYKVSGGSGFMPDYKKGKEIRKQMLSEADISKNDFLVYLNNDEHIDFAIKREIITSAYLITFWGPTGNRVDSCNKKVFYINNACFNKCIKESHNDDCTRIKSERCIENDELHTCLDRIDIDYGDNFILDIDLDFFNTIKSVKPDNTDIFYHLIRQAKIITIATEPFFVDDCKLDEEVDSEYLLKEILKHIDIALK